ncbi:UNVERIFIED_CONTAM: hypothetical protein HDU68_006165 [Siphonaria sp. JEL0065]|nr:hypothetical protein HDU68_006165 [Siphonaria sp. JEL0065]
MLHQSTARALSTATSATRSTVYQVQRQPDSGWLPVYRDYQRSHNLVKATIIKRVSGDSEKLLTELTQALKTDGKINIRNGNVHLKGDHLHAGRDFLTERGF